jgi:hypothetical protein
VIPNGRAWQTDTRTGAQRRVDGRPTKGDRYPTKGDKCLTEGVRVPNGEREWPNGGLDLCPMEGGVLGGGATAGLGGGPTGDYISAGGPPFWILSSCAQSHLQEMQECMVLMSESGPFWVNSERNVLLINASLIRINHCG